MVFSKSPDGTCSSFSPGRGDTTKFGTELSVRTPGGTVQFGPESRFRNIGTSDLCTPQKNVPTFFGIKWSRPRLGTTF